MIDAIAEFFLLSDRSGKPGFKMSSSIYKDYKLPL